jgi:hypothetical protein
MMHAPAFSRRKPKQIEGMSPTLSPAAREVKPGTQRRVFVAGMKSSGSRDLAIP